MRHRRRTQIAIDQDREMVELNQEEQDYLVGEVGAWTQEMTKSGLADAA